MWINRHNFVIISTFSVLKDQYNLMDIKTKRKEDLGKRLEKENLNYNTAGTSIRLSFTKLTDT